MWPSAPFGSTRRTACRATGPPTAAIQSTSTAMQPPAPAITSHTLPSSCPPGGLTWVIVYQKYNCNSAKKVFCSFFHVHLFIYFSAISCAFLQQGLWLFIKMILRKIVDHGEHIWGKNWTSYLSSANSILSKVVLFSSLEKYSTHSLQNILNIKPQI